MSVLIRNPGREANVEELLAALRRGGAELDAVTVRDSPEQLMRMALEPETIELRDAAGEVLDKARKRELLRELNQGEPVQLSLSAMVFRQSMTPRPLPVAKRAEANANHILFEPDKLEQLGTSFRRQPFLRDHDRWTLLAVGGVIESSEARTSGNWVEFHQVLHLQAEWAVRAALDGTLRTFSIGAGLRRGAKVRDSLMCSVCDGPWISADCAHWPGEEVKLDGSGQRVIVELIWRNAQGSETSGVSFPAVAGTKIDDVTQLNEDKQGNLMREKLIKLLGLSADATDEDIAAAVAQRTEAGTALAEATATADGLRAQLAEQVTLLAASQEQLTAATAALAASSAKVTELEGEAIEALLTRARAEGRLRPGQEAIERVIRGLSATDRTAAEAYVAGLAQIDPIGGPPQTPPPAPKHTAENEFGLTAQQLDICAQMGVEPQKYRELLDQEQQQGA